VHACEAAVALIVAATIAAPIADVIAGCACVLSAARLCRCPRQDFKRQLETAIAQREVLLTDRGHERPSAGPRQFPQDEIVRCVRELVRMENNSLHHRDAFEAAEAAMRDKPDALLQRIVTHFGKLFDVRRLEGMFPKMNVRAASVVLVGGVAAVVGGVVAVADSVVGAVDGVAAVVHVPSAAANVHRSCTCSPTKCATSWEC
jgi:hypothetical protein